MKYIDLHVHSNVSDGTLTPSEVVNLAVKSQLAAIALTDHDTLAGIQQAQAAALSETEAGNPIQVIPGTELSVFYRKRDIHILGLFVDGNNTILYQALENARLKRDERNEKMTANLRSAGIDITVDKLRQEEGEAVLTRAHFAKFMVKYGYCKSMQDAFTRYLNDDSPYYVPREYLSPAEAIDLIHTAGGLSVAAHPLLYKYTLEEVEQMVSYLSDRGLDGIEAIYSTNTGFDEGRMIHLANKYNLVITGGSDFHGANKPDISLGSGRGNLKIPYSILEKLEDRLKSRN
ncbi:PHP domain-containing protein [Anaerocolumna sedimenticola]|uniref:PHP domain-containing protein n=1 Tax=Anaerocolumna sedimenticola TaxID=2696063 RepID=A0A6P1TL95_9FIRM|nr:PHP domain-containing protein [Anaerocolumna sedimenticola]QHQ61193.1 PHP domain-containing protein [Anaerocolumna sedimenticola]